MILDYLINEGKNKWYEYYTARQDKNMLALNFQNIMTRHVENIGHMHI